MVFIVMFKQRFLKRPSVSKEKIKHNRARLFRTCCDIDFRKMWADL